MSDVGGPVVIAIEANIGAGKTTLINKLKSELELHEGLRNRITVMEEPVDDWVAKGFLEAMYENSDNAWLQSTFQHMVLMSLTGKLLGALARKPPPAVIIMERSPFSNYHIFGRANLSGLPLDMYRHTWEHIMCGMPSTLVVKYVYLRTDVDTLLRRMTARGRMAEANVARTYLEKLHRHHEEFIQNSNSVVIDGNSKEEEVFHAFLSCVKEHMKI